ncbi:MAG: aldo/keto reductase [Candidatus Izemoplasmatales bacterium]|nr:aldo/keto reductase [Candidatus Izemoplasmatales bacterium]
MKYIPYANTNKLASRISFGGWQLGNNEFWGEMTHSEGVELVKQAYTKGITLFDTAPGYSGGESEKIIGEALHAVREKVIINSKIGHKANGLTDFSVNSMKEQIKDSLARLNTDYLDSVVLHNPGMEILSGNSGHFIELEKLKNEGLIRAYGVSIDTHRELLEVLNKTDVQVVEILFNVFFQSPLSLFDVAKTKGITLIIKVPLDSGWLSGKYNEFSSFDGIRSRWDKPTIERRAYLVNKMKQITNDDNLTKYAISFILSFDSITSVITGIKNFKQLQENINAESFILNDEIKNELLKLYDEEIKDQPLQW